MSDDRIIVYGNSGSGKTTTARRLCRQLNLPHLDLDTIAWQTSGARKPVEESVEVLDRFIKAHDGWVIEGSYSSLVEAALPWCTELLFLNPGMGACARNARFRPWEPHKYATIEGQAEGINTLITWIKLYQTRDDEFSFARHRAIFDGFAGKKSQVGDEPLVTA